MLNVKTKQNPNLHLVYQLDVLADLAVSHRR